MKNNALVSIITVCFNCDDMLIDTIESVINQEYKNIEYIFIDGGSSDDTLNIIKQYSSKYSFISYISEDDNGIYDAMNKGIRISKGDLIYFLNAGDRLNNDSVLTKIANCFMTMNSHIIYGDVINEYESEPRLQKGIKVSYFSFIMDKMVCHQAIFARREVYEKTGFFNEKYKICADFDWLIKCYKNNLVMTYIPIVVAIYDMSGVSSNNVDLLRYEHEIIIKEYFGTIFQLVSKLKHAIGKTIKLRSRYNEKGN